MSEPKAKSRVTGVLTEATKALLWGRSTRNSNPISDGLEGRQAIAEILSSALIPVGDLPPDEKFCFSCDANVLATLDDVLRFDDSAYVVFALGERAQGLVALKRFTSPKRESGEWRVLTLMHEVTFPWAYYRHPKTAVDVVVVRSPSVVKRPFSVERFLRYHQRTLKVHKWTLVYLAVAIAALNLLLSQLGVTSTLLRSVVEWTALGIGSVASITAMSSET
jgi:hypothetical protein